MALYIVHIIKRAFREKTTCYNMFTEIVFYIFNCIPHLGNQTDSGKTSVHTKQVFSESPEDGLSDRSVSCWNNIIL